MSSESEQLVGEWAFDLLLCCFAAEHIRDLWPSSDL